MLGGCEGAGGQNHAACSRPEGARRTRRVAGPACRGCKSDAARGPRRPASRLDERMLYAAEALS
eukprot:179914-Pyramimonas_sp.AAC.1